MFYFDEINGKKVLKSSLIEGAEHFFTTRECNINDLGFENLVHLWMWLKSEKLIIRIQTD